MEFLRRRFGLILQLLVSALIIAALTRVVDWHSVLLNVRTMDIGWIATAFVCFAPVLFIVSWRWRMLLGVHGVHLRFWRVFELTMIGQFFSAIGVGTTGGDVIKIFYAARAVPQRRAAVAFTIVIDRVIGLVALLLFGVLLSIPNLHLLLSTPKTQAATATFYFFAIAAGVVSLFACVGPFVMKVQTLRALVKKLPLIHRIAPLFMVYEHSARAFGTNLIALVGSVPSHICSTLLGYSVLRAMNLQPVPNLLTAAAIIAIVNMLIALPVSFSGLGLREGLFLMFFGLLGIPADKILAFSLTCFCLNLLWCLVGGPFYFLYRHETHTPAPDVSEVEPIFSER
jgi:glycosyltransferase 2 family protein